MDWLKNKLSNLNIDFVGKRKYFAALSITMVLLSWFLFLVFPGPKWGIDFEGGTELHIKFGVDADGKVNEGAEPVTIDRLRETLKALEFGDDVVQRVGTPDEQEYQIRIKDTTEGSQELQAQVREALIAEFGESWLKPESGWNIVSEVGTRIDVTYVGDPTSVVDVSRSLSAIDGLTVSESKEVNQVSIRLPGIAQIIQRELRSQYPGNVLVLSSDSVGPKVGGDLATQGFVAIVITLGLVLVYIAFRFDIGFAPGAVIALVHDVSLTAGVFVVLGLEFNLPIVGALLTIVGYSLNDTIVIYDRIRENQDRYQRKDVAELINVSVNETMARTLA
ncbi:MAG: preprotein translocase subunit SecF, partial [Kiritimatiellia bacterium]